MSSEATFPLLNLPDVAVRDILLKLQCSEQLCLSIISKRCWRLVRSFKNATVEGLNVRFEGKFVKITAGVAEQSNPLWFFKFESIRFMNVLRLENIDYKLYKIGSDELRIRMVGSLLATYILHCHNTEELIKTAIDYLMDLFKCSIHTVAVLDSYTQPLPELTAIFDRCERLIFSRTDAQFGNEYVKNLLENITISKHLLISLDRGNRLFADLRKMRLIESIDIRGETNRFYKRLMFEANCTSAILKTGYSNFTPTECVDFVGNWMNSEAPKLQYASIVTTRRMDYAQFEQFGLLPWNPDVRGKMFRCESLAVDCSTGRDIIRSDGLMATIMCSPINLMFLLVWHNRFPDITGARIIGPRT